MNENQNPNSGDACNAEIHIIPARSANNTTLVDFIAYVKGEVESICGNMALAFGRRNAN